MTTITYSSRARFFRRLWQKNIHILAGSLIQGFAMGVFLFPHAIPAGGCAGLAILLYHSLQLPVSIGLWATNILFLLLAVHHLGRVSAVGTIIVITATAVSVNFFQVYLHSPFSNVWLDLIAGSVFLGAGISVLLRERFTNGGIGFVALALARRRKVNPGSTLFWMNAVIFLLTAVVIDWSIIVLALLCQWISTRIVKMAYSPVMLLKRPLYFGAWRKK
ncbi:YitT family protein [Paenibacillus antibioticophila]|uniref:YitT family protein n=1 Tax=Paenibacillus antibioticophila TaxID=1274374 RepID=UPI000A96639D|nr:YitT family protein [Paenibacillus antibioticophila]